MGNFLQRSFKWALFFMWHLYHSPLPGMIKMQVYETSHSAKAISGKSSHAETLAALQEAAQHSSDLAEQLSALYRLMEIYLRGNGVDRDLVKATQYAQQVVALSGEGRNRIRALTYLADIYYLGGPGIVPDFDKAYSLYYQVAVQRDFVYERAWALRKLGDMNYCGRGAGFGIDYDKSRRYYELASAQDDNLSTKVWSLIKLGDLNFFHRPSICVFALFPDYVKARLFYQQAAEINYDLPTQTWAILMQAETYYFRQASGDEECARILYEKVLLADNNRKARGLALCRLGEMYLCAPDEFGSALNRLFGSAVLLRDVDKARNFLEEAAAQDDSIEGQARAQILLNRINGVSSCVVQ